MAAISNGTTCIYGIANGTFGNLFVQSYTLSAYPGGTASASFVGTITKVDDKGSNKGFTAVSITAVDYEGITPA